MGYMAVDPQASSGPTGQHLHSPALPAAAAAAVAVAVAVAVVPPDPSRVAGPHLHMPAVLPAAATEALPAALPRTGWTASASDEEVTRTNGRAGNVLDGSAATYWHSRWSPAPAAPLPHSITIDTKATQSIAG
ncbi:hypothetical protein ABIB26_004843, partial [Arthrobacter sp. UYEF20]